MENLTLTQIIEKLETFKANVFYDLQSTYINDGDKRVMQQQFQLLIIATANLQTLHGQKQSQIFSSSISY
jgi:hypothetical protein